MINKNSPPAYIYLSIISDQYFTANFLCAEVYPCGFTTFQETILGRTAKFSRSVSASINHLNYTLPLKFQTIIHIK